MTTTGPGTTTVRAISEGEVEPWTSRYLAGFYRQVPEGYPQYLAETLELERTVGAFDGKEVVGTLRSFPTPMTLPGNVEHTVAAVSNVTVAPSHRRRGLLNEMMAADLASCRTRGEALSILIGSEYPIYGRYGYGPAVEGAIYEVDTTAVRFYDGPPGRIQLTDLGELGRLAPAIYDRYRLSQPGAIGRDGRWWDRTLRRTPVPGDEPSKEFAALYLGAGDQAEGYVRYEVQQAWKAMRPDSRPKVTDLVSTTVDAYRGLWHFCCNLDLVRQGTVVDRSVDEAVGWMVTDGRAIRQTERFDFVWVRVLDVATALSARRYGTEGRLVLEITDNLGIAQGRYALEASPEGAECSKTAAGAELTMPVATLGSAFMGGVPIGALASAGRLREERTGAVRLADRMFRTGVTPWCNTWF